jgi:PBP1b-binding outer membrane lipoprotein LpoB
MKKITYIIALLALVLYGCKGEDNVDPSAEAQEEAIAALQGTWSTVEVRKENAVISDFADFTLTINEKSYNTANGAPVWPSSGSFDFENLETENEFVRQDGRLFTATMQDSNLAITIIYQEETGRGEYGTYSFLME